MSVCAMTIPSLNPLASARSLPARKNALANPVAHKCTVGRAWLFREVRLAVRRTVEVLPGEFGIPPVLPGDGSR